MSNALNEIFANHPNATVDKLIPILQAAQRAEGYLSMETIHAIAAHLRIPSGKVFGVATFYNQFRFEPAGRCRVTACRGTACHVRGGRNVINSIESHLGVRDGETTPDLKYTFETIACLGACALAPVIVVDSKYYGKVTPKKALTIIENQ
ncbi:MAG: NADH-quinone oxidoreductase subunit NuoE [Deltaproteobacteria bacterium]|nr:NADH-quinone oxidoreductase subunit NuoE [Deltaproteobacteria bacterium]